MRSPVRSPALVRLTLMLVALIAGCGAGQTLPGMVGDPQAPRGEPAGVPLTGAGEGVVVEYFVLCNACSAAWSTPDGTSYEPAVEGSLNRRVRFRAAAGGSVVALTLPSGPPGLAAPGSGPPPAGGAPDSE